jgi:alpha-D-xyloside xylohydrolase
MQNIVENVLIRTGQTEVLWVPGNVEKVEAYGEGVAVWVQFYAYTACGECFVKDAAADVVVHRLLLRAYGDDVIRMTFDPLDQAESDSPMLEKDAMPDQTVLRALTTETGYEVQDAAGRCKAQINCAPIPTHKWSDLLPATEKMLEIVLYPDAETPVPLKSYDMFAHGRIESLPLGYIEKNGRIDQVVFSFAAQSDETFFGTGERFAKLDLSGRTLLLENTDGMGVNSKRCYKNIPFFMSSRPYGVFLHTSARVQLSLADISTRAAQGRIAEPLADIFVIGGGELPAIQRNYCSLTGFAPALPIWSYGVWMARMTYYSADEVQQIAEKMREYRLPCDVMHIDTGWFSTDWVCDWKFCESEFPAPEKFIAAMRRKGFRISLWQTPDISARSSVAATAKEHGYVPKVAEKSEAGSDFSKQDLVGQIDFSNPAASVWYQNDLLRPLLEMGVAVIKTDFGENIAMDAEYAGIRSDLLRNRYALLYQRAAFEVSENIHGAGNALIWARAAWAGCQRYPLHWGGDAESSWEGLAGTLRGGLHLGMSGFTYWSHDVPGFHGTPDFMNSWPSDELYVRWTQFGVFSSHTRFHGASPREPYEYPAVMDTVRSWLNLRYAIIPYIMEQAEKARTNGLPMVRALVLYDGSDPVCRHIDSEYMFGEDFLAAPVMNAEGQLDIYLPRGRWVDFWTGEVLEGRQWLYGREYPLHRMPLFVREGADIAVYPEVVQSTDEMDLDKVVKVRIERGFAGLPVAADLWSDK